MRLVPPVVFACLLLPTAAACHENPCWYPVGFCGEYQRQSVVFCYYVVEGRYVPALEEDVLNLTTPAAPEAWPPGTMWPSQGPHAYVWLAPLEAFLADPTNDRLPPAVYRETNSVAGLQAKPFRCGTWVWFGEYDCWFGPFNPGPRMADQMVV